MKYIKQHILSILIIVITMLPVTAWSFSISVDQAGRTLEVSNNALSPKLYTDTGLYAPTPLYVWPGFSTRGIGGAEFDSSNIPVSGEYSSYVVSADMHSWVDEDLVYPVGWAEADLHLLFTVDTTVNWSINATGNETGVGEIGFSLTGPSGEVCSLQGCLSSGTLLPGQYELHALTFVNTTSGLDVGDVRLNFDMTLSEVPVPASVWLFGTGLIGLIGIARRKQSV